LPVWAAKLNEDHFADRFFGTRWERCLPEAVYAQYCRADEAAYERGPTKQLANTFPKIIDGHESEPSPAYYEALACSPLGNELVLELARCTIDAEQLGVDETSDLLGIGLSSNDAVGHLFGPYSHEALDMTVRTDQQLSAFLNWLDARVGLGHCLIVVTADHGVGLEPEYARELRLGGGRVDPRKVMDDVESALVRRFGAPSDGRPFVTGFKAPWLYLNMVVLDEMEIARAEAARIGAAALAGHTGHVPRAGIAGAYPGVPAELAEAATDDPIAACALQSTFPGRSGEIYVHLEPFWGFSSLAAEHSSANSYDRHVPILILGSRIAAGRYSQPADPCDLAVTLAMLLDLAPPVNATGRVLREAITDSAAR
jgi:hypothetical protein